MSLCQVLDYSSPLICPSRESGGVQCEVVGVHSEHWISDHTIRHSLAGNGWHCSAIHPHVEDYRIQDVLDEMRTS